MILYLVRHGETDWNYEQRVQGISDVPINDRGEKQAYQLAESLQNLNIKVIYSSPLRRAQQTAKIISEALSMEIKTVKDLMELNQGSIEGLTYDELHYKYPELVRIWRTDPANAKMPQGEDLKELQTRAWKAIKKIAKDHNTESVVVVSHNLAIRSLLCKFLNLNLKYFRRIHLDTASKNIIEFFEPKDNTGREILVRSVNDVSFLKNDYDNSSEGI